MMIYTSTLEQRPSNILEHIVDLYNKLIAMASEKRAHRINIIL